jgi:rRNA-processing protein FCF1
MKVNCPKCKRRIRITRGQILVCKCGNRLDYQYFFRRKSNKDIFLIDANVIIYSVNNNMEFNTCCKKILCMKSNNIRIATTERVKKEVKGFDMPNTIISYKTGPITNDLLDLKTNYLKQPSEADLSLIQAARQHPEIKGLITYDKDFCRIAACGIIEKKSSTKFWLGTAKEFLRKYDNKILNGNKKYGL